MSLQKINTRNIVLILMIVAVLPMRLLSYYHPYTLSNFTPMGAIALFSGAYFTDKWKAYMVVLLSLFVSDIVINYLYTSKLIWLNSGSPGVYLVFIITVFIGHFIKKATVVNVGLASLVPVCLHWLIINLPWFYATLYPHNLNGYGQSLVAAIPFERNMLLADIVFCAILFGGFELAKSKFTSLRTNNELAV